MPPPPSQVGGFPFFKASKHAISAPLKFSPGLNMHLRAAAQASRFPSGGGEDFVTQKEMKGYLVATV